MAKLTETSVDQQAEALAGENATITISSKDAEPWRLDRLRFVVGYIAALAVVGAVDVVSRLLHLHDHEGVLTAVWVETPSAFDRVVVERAWVSAGEDDACVTHQVDS